MLILIILSVLVNIFTFPLPWLREWLRTALPAMTAGELGYLEFRYFDGSGWTDMKITATPGERYGAQVAVDPRSGHTFLFGGLVVKTEGTVQTQEYRNDTWEWNGSAWQQLAPAISPPARENGGFEFDPGRNELVLFGGYAGFFQSDLWAFDGTNWSVRSQAPQQRRRAGR